MVDYPLTLPLPNNSSYSGIIGTGLVRTNIPAALANQLQTFNSPRTEISMTFSMDNFTYINWIIWVQGNAYQWFNMPVISGSEPDVITSTRQVRFISDTAYTKQGDNWVSVSVSAELLPGQPLALPPTERTQIITEALDNTITESGDTLITERSP